MLFKENLREVSIISFKPNIFNSLANECPKNRADLRTKQPKQGL